MSATLTPSELTRPQIARLGQIPIREVSADERVPPFNPFASVWRDEMIRRAAYFRSLHRRPCLGKELEDWLAAEREVDELTVCGFYPLVD